MQKNVYRNVGITVGVTLLLVMVWGISTGVDDSSQKPSISSSDGDVLVTEKDTITDSPESIVVEERRTIDIDTVIAEIESSASGDETALDEELAGESASVQEGQIIMQQLGDGYDETNY